MKTILSEGSPRLRYKTRGLEQSFREQIKCRDRPAAACLPRESCSEFRGTMQRVLPTRENSWESLRGRLRHLLQRSLSVHGEEQPAVRSEEHTSELQSPNHPLCPLLP